MSKCSFQSRDTVFAKCFQAERRFAGFAWLAHFLIESSRAAAFDRPQVLHEHAEAAALLNLDMLAERRDRIDPNQTIAWGDSYADGGTMYMCVVDGNGMGVSLIQSNAAGFGAHIMIGGTGVFLHNRGIGP